MDGLAIGVGLLGIFLCFRGLRKRGSGEHGSIGTARCYLVRSCTAFLETLLNKRIALLSAVAVAAWTTVLATDEPTPTDTEALFRIGGLNAVIADDRAKAEEHYNDLVSQRSNPDEIFDMERSHGFGANHSGLLNKELAIFFEMQNANRQMNGGNEALRHLMYTKFRPANLYDLCIRSFHATSIYRDFLFRIVPADEPQSPDLGSWQMVLSSIPPMHRAEFMELLKRNEKVDVDKWHNAITVGLPSEFHELAFSARRFSDLANVRSNILGLEFDRLVIATEGTFGTIAWFLPLLAAVFLFYLSAFLSTLHKSSPVKQPQLSL